MNGIAESFATVILLFDAIHPAVSLATALSRCRNRKQTAECERPTPEPYAGTVP